MQKPHPSSQGPVFDKRKRCRLTYWHLLREEEKQEKLSYTNYLHDALRKKNGKLFWNCWHAKCEHSVPCTHVDCCADSSIVVNKFAEFFNKSYSYNNRSRADLLRDKYEYMRSDYVGAPLLASHTFDTELVSKIVLDMHRGKALDIVGLTVEHIHTLY